MSEMVWMPTHCGYLPCGASLPDGYGVACPGCGRVWDRIAWPQNVYEAIMALAGNEPR